MARGEVSVTCPQCGSRSRMPVTALQRDNYHCSRCGSHVPLSGFKADAGDELHQPPRARSKRPFHRRRRR